MLTRGNRVLSTIALTGVLVVSGGAAASSSHASPARTPAPARVASSATITSVVFTGTPVHPTITIHGSGFGRKPHTNLPIVPYNAGSKYGSACTHQRVAGDGKDGHDYDHRLLGVGWGTTPPTGYGAGVYSPHHYLDCIGLKIVKYTGHLVVLHLGCQYALYPKIHAGNKALIVVNHRKIRLTVAYHHA
jgi:hypothetical protein